MKLWHALLAYIVVMGSVVSVVVYVLHHFIMKYW